MWQGVTRDMKCRKLSNMENKKVRFGIVGVGGMGGHHAKNLLENKVTNAELAAVCDVNPAVMERFPGVGHFSSSEELIRCGLIDAIFIATPHYSHTPIGIDALGCGLHVLMEKPLSVQKADCEKLIAAHRDPRQVFAIMLQFRAAPHFIALREMVRSGELGQIRRIHWTLTNWFRTEAYYASNDWRATWAGEGGGILVNQLPHDLDLFQWIFGLPARVRALCQIGKYHEIEVEDAVSALLEFADGATATLVASTGESPGTDHREVIGEWGRVVLHPDHLQFTRNAVPATEFSRTTKERFGKPETSEISIPITGPAPDGHVAILQNFVDAILLGTPLISPAEDGIRGVELANAILLASEQDRTVELPLDAAAYAKFLDGKIAASKAKTKQPVPATAAAADMAASFH